MAGHNSLRFINIAVVAVGLLVAGRTLYQLQVFDGDFRSHLQTEMQRALKETTRPVPTRPATEERSSRTIVGNQTGNQGSFLRSSQPPVEPIQPEVRRDAVAPPARAAEMGPTTPVTREPAQTLRFPDQNPAKPSVAQRPGATGVTIGSSPTFNPSTGSRQAKPMQPREEKKNSWADQMGL